MRVDPGSIPGSGRSPGGENGNPLQYACLENPMDGEAWCRLQSMGRKELDMIERDFTFTTVINEYNYLMSSSFVQFFC